MLQEAYRFENCTGGFMRVGATLLFAIGFTTALGVQRLEAKQVPAPEGAQAR